MDIIDLRQEQEERERMLERLEAEIKALEDLAQDFTAKGEQAAEAGDTDQYLVWKQKAERANAEAYVKRVMRDRAKVFTREDVIKAWREYSEGYTKEYTKRLDQYNKLLSKLRDVYREMLDAQREAIMWREYACRQAGVQRVSSISDEDVASMFPMEMLPFTLCRVNDAAEAALFCPGEERNAANSLLKFRLLQPING